MKSTKNKLLSSIATLCVCFAMLIGSTYAWFTDTASTGVNKIQAGNLDVEIVDPVTETELTTLSWIKAGSATGEVLWEPGATYKLTTFEVKNAGNLALKFKMNISVGSEIAASTGEKLSDVISWKIYSNDTSIIGSEAAELYSDFNKDQVYELGVGESKVFSILATMSTSAGNEYKNLSMDSITVDVIAAQDTVENDSFNNQYDGNAAYPVVAVASVQVDANKKVTSKVKVSTAEMVGTTPQATLTVPQGVKVADENTKSLDFSIEEISNNSNSGIEVSTVTKVLEISVEGLDSANNSVPLTVEAFVGIGLENLTLKHNGNSMNKKNLPADVTADQDYYYDSGTGYVIFKSCSFSPFEIEYDKNTYAISNKEDLLKFADLVNDGNSFAGKTVTLENDINLSGVAWNPIGGSSISSYPGNNLFKGIFDGQNHIISNLTVSASGIYATAGLFGATYGEATIKNVVLENAHISSTHYAGGILGYETNRTSIINCTVKNSTITSAAENSSGNWDNGDKVGGVVGYMHKADIRDCTVENTTIKGYRDIGGIAGYIGKDGESVEIAVVKNCTISNVTILVDKTYNYKNYVDIDDHDAKSIVGEYYGTIENCPGEAIINFAS